MHQVVKPDHFVQVVNFGSVETVEPDGIHAVGLRAPVPGDFEMTNKPDPKGTSKNPAEPHPGMMGDGSEEQNLGQPGNPAARIKKNEVDAAFGKDDKKKK
jgi:hypothetical protein